MEKDVGDGVGIGQPVWVPQDLRGGGPPTLGGLMSARAVPPFSHPGRESKKSLAWGLAGALLQQSFARGLAAESLEALLLKRTDDGIPMVPSPRGFVGIQIKTGRGAVQWVCSGRPCQCGD